jgi:hypothetical protein
LVLTQRDAPHQVPAALADHLNKRAADSLRFHLSPQCVVAAEASRELPPHHSARRWRDAGGPVWTLRSFSSFATEPVNLNEAPLPGI